MQSNRSTLVTAALVAHGRGWTPVPLRPGEKRPTVAQWTRLVYEHEEAVRTQFDTDDCGGLGLAVGTPSGGLVDVDLDHHRARRLAPLVLPRTPMMSGRASARWSHYWYLADEYTPEGTRQWKLPNGKVIVELRSTGGQTVIPPSVHPTGEAYLWEGEPWGGDTGPAQIPGNVLTARVASLALIVTLADAWPEQGGRHAAYLALAGGLLRTVDGNVHPLWREVLPQVIHTLAEATGDEDGPETRVSETVPSTLRKLESGGKVQGWPTLAGLIGQAHAEMARRAARDIEQALGHSTERSASSEPVEAVVTSLEGDDTEIRSVAPPEERNPLDERLSSWEAVDLEPYLLGEVKLPEPNLLRRSDGAALLYPGRVNMLYGRSESGKSWVALHAAIEVMNDGGRVLYIDCEDDPVSTLARMLALGVGHDDINSAFTYIRPEGPLTQMTMPRWGEVPLDKNREMNDAAISGVLTEVDPTLIVVDGMTALYGMHGLDINDGSQTDRITSWLRWITRAGRSTVLIIDHVPKGSQRAATSIGSQHKTAMVQGTALHVYPLEQPRPGAVGRLELIVGKDRPGRVRSLSTDEDPQVAAEITIDSSHADGGIRITIDPGTKGAVIGASDAGSQILTQLHNQRGKLVAALERHAPRGLTQTELLNEAGGLRKVTQEALNSLINNGAIEVSKSGRSYVHNLVRRPDDLGDEIPADPSTDSQTDRNLDG
jgi:hypothetical protein